MTAWIVKRDGELRAVCDDEFQMLAWMHRNQSQSLDWAIAYEGWSVEEVQPWPAEADPDDDSTRYNNAKHLRMMARQLLRGDEHHRSGNCRSDRIARENCGTCALRGYEPRGGWGDDYSVKRDGPNYAGWARVYVEAGYAIPAKWRDAFDRQRHSDNRLYAAALARSIETFGVKYDDEETAS